MKKRNILSFGLLGITLLSSQFMSNDNIVVNNSLKTEENNNYVCEVVTGNMNTIGSKYTCTFDDGVPRTFYVLEDGDNTTLIKGSTGTAKNVEVSLPTAAQIAEAGGDTNWRSDAQTTGKALESWLWEYLREDGFPVVGYWTSTIYDSEYSWVVNDIDNKYGAGNGRLVTGKNSESNVYGVRPVITVSKSLINDSVAKEDTENKITLSASSASVISGSTELKVESIATESETYTEIKKYITNIENIKVYDINLYENGTKIQPNGKVSLTFEVENMDINKVKVYRMNDDKTYTKIETKVVDNKLQIEVDHFSVYILTEEEINTDVIIDNNTNDEEQIENPDTGEKIVYVVAMSTLVILLIASIIVKLKKGEKEY